MASYSGRATIVLHGPAIVESEQYAQVSQFFHGPNEFMAVVVGLS